MLRKLRLFIVIYMALILNTGLFAGEWRVVGDFTPKTKGATRSLAVYDSLVFGVTGYTFFKSNGNYIVDEYFSGTIDGGKTWNYKVISNIFDSIIPFQELLNLNYLSKNEIITIGNSGYINKSTDNGNTWTSKHLFNIDTIPMQTIEFRLDLQKKNAALVVNHKDLYVSNDSCNNWRHGLINLTFGLNQYIPWYAFNFNDSSVYVYFQNPILSNNKLVKSKNLFETYDVLDLKNGGKVAIQFFNKEFGFMSFLDSTKATNYPTSVFRTENAGVKWTPTQFYGTPCPNNILFSRISKSLNNSLVAYSPFHFGFLESFDSGISWQYMSLKHLQDSLKSSDAGSYDLISDSGNHKFFLTRYKLFKYFEDPSSVDFSHQRNVLNIYPNPIKSNEILHIRGDFEIGSNFVILIYDLLGNIVFQKELDIISRTFEIELPKLVSGKYNIMLNSGHCSSYNSINIEN